MVEVERFFNKVKLPDGCWEWQGVVHASGYGQARQGDTMAQAHRVAYDLFVGPIPEGLQLDHLCRNRRCVNPAHLEPVTPKENVLRGVSPSANQARQRECVNGHAFDETNTYVSPNGYRTCRTCARERYKRYRARRSENGARRAEVLSAIRTAQRAVMAQELLPMLDESWTLHDLTAKLQGLRRSGLVAYEVRTRSCANGNGTYGYWTAVGRRWD